MEMASMGWMAVGIGRLAAPFNSLTTEDTQATEEFFPLEADASATLLLFLFFFYAVFWSLRRATVPCGFLFIELCQCFCQPGCLNLPARCLAITLPLGGTLIACNLAHSTPGERGLIILLDVIAFDYRIVLLLDQKPFGAFTSRTA